MDTWALIFVVFGAVTIAMIATGWAQLLEHNRRKQAMDIIKTAIEQGKEAPPVIYEQLANASRQKAPWSEVVIFTALSIGFWIAASQTADDLHLAFTVVASTMTVTALGCLALGLMRPGAKRDDKR
jgi:ABC-type siderophore export system fused ATPase/permease subunit